MRRPSLLAFPLLLIAAAGCSKDDILSYRVPKEAVPGLPAALSAAGPAPAETALPETAPASPAEAGLAWKVPAGWTALPASGMRFASFKTPAQDGPGAEVSVVVLPGSAGGVLPNVNRWRGQIGLAPLDEAGLRAEGKSVKSAAGELLTVDFAGTSGGGPARLTAAILAAGEKTWFFKMTGNEGAVARARPSFLAFLKSLAPAGS